MLHYYYNGPYYREYIIINSKLYFFFSFFFEKEFQLMAFTSDDNLWRLLLMIALYHQTKTPISFWCRQGLNHISLIQPLETLLVELTGTHNSKLYLVLLYLHGTIHTNTHTQCVYVCVCVYIYIYISFYLPSN